MDVLVHISKNPPWFFHCPWKFPFPFRCASTVDVNSKLQPLQPTNQLCHPRVCDYRSWFWEGPHDTCQPRRKNHTTRPHQGATAILGPGFRFVSWIFVWKIVKKWRWNVGESFLVVGFYISWYMFDCSWWLLPTLQKNDEKVAVGGFRGVYCRV